MLTSYGCGIWTNYVCNLNFITKITNMWMNHIFEIGFCLVQWIACVCSLCIFYCVIWVRLREKFIVYRFHLYEYWLLWMSLLFAGVLHEPESGKSFDMWLWNASTQKCAYIFPFAKLNRIKHTHTYTIHGKQDKYEILIHDILRVSTDRLIFC